MSAPVPPIEETKLRTTISLDARIVLTIDECLTRAKAHNHKATFSDVVTDALIVYAEKHHPGLLRTTTEKIIRTPEMVRAHKWFKTKNPTGKKIPAPSKRKYFKGKSSQAEPTEETGT